jgi:hypothetical protein
VIGPVGRTPTGWTSIALKYSPQRSSAAGFEHSARRHCGRPVNEWHLNEAFTPAKQALG